jgi:hypothetical protein
VFPPGENLYQLPDTNIQFINSVSVDGGVLDPDEYMYSREYGWIIVDTIPVTELVVNYNYSRSLDMVVTNWDANIGNYLYYNQLKYEDLDATGELSWSNVSPNVTVNGSFEIANIGGPGSELSWRIDSYPSWGNWSIVPSSGDDLTPEASPLTINVQVVAPDSGGPVFTGEVVIINVQNSSDYAVIPVVLELQTEPGPAFDITSITGGFGVKITFSNVGDANASGINIDMQIKGGIFYLINKKVTDSLQILAPGKEYSVSSGLFLGLGDITIHFIVNSNENASAEVDEKGKQLLIFTLLI